MPELTKAQKIKVALSLIWLILSFLISVSIYEEFSRLSGNFILINFPLLIYWLGFWIWGGWLHFNSHEAQKI